jgi:hypothetical protein
MDKKTLINKIFGILKNTYAENKAYNLLMFLLFDLSGETKIGIMLSAEWLDKKSESEALTSIIELFQKNLTEDERRSLLRITILNTNSDIVRNISSGFKVESGSDVELRNVVINGLAIDWAIIMETK